MSKFCWASALGGCKGGFSGEHVFTKSLWTGKTVHVEGFPFLKGKPGLIGINSLRRNILCSHHNSLLSDVDETGTIAFRSIRKFEEVLSGRKSCNGEDLKCEIDGYLLERWFIKHAINLFALNNENRKYYDGSEFMNPPKNIILAAFGKERLLHPCGLYNWAGQEIGEKKIVGDQVSFIPIYDVNEQYCGALFEFQALSFLIWFTTATIVPWEFARKFYHHAGGIFETSLQSQQASFKVIW